MSEWPLVGRQRELGFLSTCLGAEACRGVVLAGPAGVGKTRLGIEGMRLAEANEFATARITGTRAAAGIPLGVLAPLLPPVGETTRAAVEDRSDLLRRCASALGERFGQGRILLFIDNAQFLDPASATVIHQVAATATAFVLATIRTGEPAPEPVVSLWKDGLAERLEIAGLQVDAIEELLSLVLGGLVDRATVVRLAVRCQGNVLFLRELVMGALADGTLSHADGIWALEGPVEPSQRLVELVESRLAGLSGAERALLEVVALGEPLGRAELTNLADHDVAERLERTDLLASTMDGRRLVVRLAHGLYGDVVRSAMPALRVPTVSRALAETVQATGARRREDLLRVAVWQLSAGSAEPDILMAGASTARWRYDFSLAERLARAAVDAGGGFEPALLAARLAGLQGRGGEAEVEFALLSTLAAEDGQRARLATARIDNLVFYLGDADEALRIADRAAASVSDPARLDEIMSKRAWLVGITHGPASAADSARPLLEHAKGDALVLTCIAAAYSLSRVGQLGAALEAADLGYETQATLSTPVEWYPWSHMYLKGLALSDAGRLDDAQLLAEEHYHEGIANQSAEAQAIFATLLAQVAVQRGRGRTAVRFGREAVAAYRRVGRPLFIGLSLTPLALALIYTGEKEEADRVLSELVALPLPQTLPVAVDLLRARAWASACAEDPQTAAALLDKAASIAAGTGDAVGECNALHDLARLGHAGRVRDRLTKLAATMEGELVGAQALHCKALAPRDPIRLEEVAAIFERIGADLFAAESAADAAVAWRRSGDGRRAASAERMARTLSLRCEDSVTPALRSIEWRAVLTPAELETALLAASGRTNKAIADQLHISIRTVESRLQNIYDKLGVSGRGELAEAVRPFQ